MKKIRKFILNMALLLMVFSFAYSAWAEEYTLFGKEISLDGFFRQEFSFCTARQSSYHNNQSGLDAAYQMWLVDTNLVLSPNLEIRMILREWGDLYYYMRDGNSQFEHYFQGGLSHAAWDRQWDQILREIYATYSNERMLVRVGRQQIAWGESDGLRLMDIINPLDARRMFLFYDTEGYEEVRIPKFMVKTEFYGGSFWKFSDTSLEFIWNPGDVPRFGELLGNLNETDLCGGKMYPGHFPKGTTNHWSPWAFPINWAPFPVRLRTDEKKFKISNSEFGGRVKFSFKNTFITLNYWQGFNAESLILKYRGLLPDPVGRQAPPAIPAALNFDKVQPRIRIAGFTLNRELFGVGPLTCQTANPVLRMEALYAFRQPFNAHLQDVGSGRVLPIVHYDQIRYMIGFDWNMGIPFINPTKNTFVSAQFFHIKTLNYRGDEMAPKPVPLYNYKQPADQFYSTILLKTDYMNEKVCPSFLMVWDHSCNAAWAKPTLDFKIGNHWRPQIGYLWIKANSSRYETVFDPITEKSYRVADDWKSFGTFENRDQAWVRIEYQF
ncbi:MAG TPA: hypothetical protein PKV48_02995 [Thermodesulfobacteriota bacterium]|nr:hypothetical protein [Thermodesulfobacteriota bacterium]